MENTHKHMMVILVEQIETWADQLDDLEYYTDQLSHITKSMRDWGNNISKHYLGDTGEKS